MSKKYWVNLKTSKTISTLVVLFLILTVIVGFGILNRDSETIKENKVIPDTLHSEIIRFNGEKSKVISSVYTTKKELALTFNGMGEEAIMQQLLDELDRYEIKATFFLPGMRVAEEPDIAKEILARGHEIENNTLSQIDMTKLSYEDIYKEIKLSNEVIKKETGVIPRYLRTKSGDHNDDIRLVTAQLGMEAVVSYNINPKDRDMKDAKSIGEYIKRFISRGGIVSLNTDINPEVISSISHISKAAEDIGYQFVTLQNLVANGGERKPLNEIEGFDAAKVNLDYENVKPHLFYKANTDKKVIALTFDDFASDKTVTKVLSILNEYDVKSTFFLIGKGVENNPNLARAIIDEGHEVANHSYSHQVVLTMSPEELQKDIVKGHEVITEAIQQQPTMLFRPATGVIDEETAKVIAATGYTDIALYDLTALDWDINNSSQDIIDRIMGRVETGSVIVLHILDEIYTIEALPTLIESLREKGYEFKKMSELVN